MTTAVDVDVAKRIEIRAVFGYLAEGDAAGHPYPLSIGGAQDHLRGIEDLLFLSSVTEWNEADSAAADWTARPSDFVRQVLVKKISYASPLEVVVYFLAGTTAATTAANRVIRVWENFQLARLNVRKEAAAVDIFETAGNVLQATIDAPIPLNGPGTTGYDRFLQASTTLAMLSQLEVQEEA